MRSIAALRLVGLLSLTSLASLAACEAPTPAPSSLQPSEQASEQAEATPPAPALSPAAPELPDLAELPAVAGVHYLEFVTAGADPNATLPMIVAIHGLGDSPEGFRDLLARFDRPARVILPQGLDPVEGGGWSWFPIRARDPDVEGLAKGIERAADTLARAIAELSEQRPTQGKPVVTGFSQGGMLAFTLAVHHGELLSAAFPVGGWLPPPLMPGPDADPKAAAPIVAFHGDADKAVKFEPTAAAVLGLQRAGYRVTLNEYAEVGHMISADMHAELLRNLRQTLATFESD